MNKPTTVFWVGVAVTVFVVAVAKHGNGDTSNTAAHSATVSGATISRCQLSGRTVLTGIPADATDFRFKFIGGGFTGHSWHTDWLPNDSEVKGGKFWIYTLGDGGTTPSGVTGEVEMSDGSTVETDLQECY